MKNDDEDSGIGYIIKVDFKYPKQIHESHSDSPFSYEGKKTNKCKNLVADLYNEQKYVVHIKTLKAVLNYGLVSHKVHRVIKFNQESWLK